MAALKCTGYQFDILSEGACPSKWSYSGFSLLFNIIIIVIINCTVLQSEYFRDITRLVLCFYVIVFLEQNFKWKTALGGSRGPSLVTTTKMLTVHVLQTTDW